MAGHSRLSISAFCLSHKRCLCLFVFGCIFYHLCDISSSLPKHWTLSCYEAKSLTTNFSKLLSYLNIHPKNVNYNFRLQFKKYKKLILKFPTLSRKYIERSCFCFAFYLFIIFITLKMYLKYTGS